jgi:Na+-driven multidrug efflux pump
MRQSRARLGVFYIAACEWMLGGIFALYVVFIPVAVIFSKTPNTSRSICIAVTTVLVCAGFAGICFLSGRALVHGVRWGWFCSLAMGVVVVVFSLWVIRSAMRPDQYLDSGETGMLGIAMLTFALPGLCLLALPSIRGYVRKEP